MSGAASETARITGRAISPQLLKPKLSSLVARHNQRLRIDQHGSGLQSSARLPQTLYINIGLCISGGPDSMALAYLMRNTSEVDGIGIRPRAYIIDHRAREGSTEEALHVKSLLARLGMPVKILTINWKSSLSPSELPNFESQARWNRYRLLACQALHDDVHDLFLGHHQDDQVETIMMRLITRTEPDTSVFRGISSMTPISCCDDILGAHESHETWEPMRTSQKVKLNPVMLSRPGGILLHRPLLDFCKADLIATCEANGVEYVTDRTNKDPTLTPRNAVRHMRSNHVLPNALSSLSLLKLKKVADNQFDQVTDTAKLLMHGFSLKSVDFRIGTIQIQLPQLADSTPVTIQGLSTIMLSLIDIVSPMSRSSRPQHLAKSHFDMLFNTLPEHPSPKVGNSAPNPRNFVFRLVNFEPHRYLPRTWTLTRQPMRINEVQPNSWTYRISGQSDCSNPALEYSWKLWDNRFWIRLNKFHAAFGGEIQVIPLRAIPYVRHGDKGLLGQDLKTLKEALKANGVSTKESKSLPVLLCQGRLLGLPTLGFKSESLLAELDMEIDWEVRYKTCDSLPDLLASATSSRTVSMQNDDIVYRHAAIGKSHNAT